MEVTVDFNRAKIQAKKPDGKIITFPINELRYDFSEDIYWHHNDYSVSNIKIIFDTKNIEEKLKL